MSSRATRKLMRRIERGIARGEDPEYYFKKYPRAFLKTPLGKVWNDVVVKIRGDVQAAPKNKFTVPIDGWYNFGLWERRQLKAGAVIEYDDFEPKQTSLGQAKWEISADGNEDFKDAVQYTFGISEKP